MGKVAFTVTSQYHPLPMTRTARTYLLLAAVVVLIGVLLVLVPNLDRIDLAPAQRDLTFPETVPTLSVDPGANPTGAGVMALFLRILLIAALAGLAFLILGAFFNKTLRAYLVLFVVLFLIVVGAYYLLKPRADRYRAEPTIAEGAPELQWSEGGPQTTAEQQAPPPGWSFTAAAIGLSIAAVGAAAFIWAKLVFRRRRPGEDASSELDELLGTVAAAADAIELGDDPRSAVLRCYRDMIRILCRHRPIDHIHMTPRELATALRRAGFTMEYVDRLTEIFELVRYGKRDGEALAERATGCLKAIREAYATP